jgi:ATP-dependent DNA helicase RecG
LWNPGELPENFTIETLLTVHESRPRNQLIARVFYLAGFIESWGRGYEKIRDQFAAMQLAMPTFEVVRGGMMTTIIREKAKKIMGHATPQVTPQVTPKVKELLIVLENGEMSAMEMMGQLGLKDKRNFRLNYLQPALSAGLVEMTNPDKPNSRLQRYRLK